MPDHDETPPPSRDDHSSDQPPTKREMEVPSFGPSPKCEVQKAGTNDTMVCKNKTPMYAIERVYTRMDAR